MYVIYYERTSACISKNCHSCQKRRNKNKRKKQNKKKITRSSSTKSHLNE